MISLPLLKTLGVTQKALKAAFTAKEKSETIKKFTNRMSDRIKEAVNHSTSNYQLYWAIDRALDSSFFQSSRTLFEGLMDGKKSSAEVLSMVKDFGFNKWLADACGCGGGCNPVGSCKSPVKRIDAPAFFEVTFPIALAFKTVRVARLYNDRNLFPMFKYEPLVSTPAQRLKNDLITHRVQVQAQQMDYKPVLKQVINQACSYSYCNLFPREAWWADQQPTADKTSKGKRKMRTVREGLRYDHPHPSRSYFDLNYPVYTLNSDTGCQYSGNWGLSRFGDVDGNPDYWNTDKITFGDESFRITSANANFFATVMPCTMKFPELRNPVPLGGTIDRQERMQQYTTNDYDAAVLLTNHFERLNPLKDLGLKNKDGEGYDGNVWFRFVVCSDDTVVFAEPLAYNPNLICLYDPDANKARTMSLVQECIPVQDMVGNLLTQAILQAKNNLTNVNFVNTDVLDQPVIDKLQNLGEKAHRAPIFIPFSFHESVRSDNDRREAIIPVTIQKMSIGECLTLINTLLDILSRGLVMSAQELGATDSHEVTAQEVLQKAGATSTRLNYTGSGVDDFIYHWQKQLHDAGMAYWDDEIFAEVALQDDADKKELESLGFKIETENAMERKVGVRGKKANLEVDMFTMRRDAPDRVNSVAMATAMTNFFATFINNPMAIRIIGIDQFVQLVNGILDSFQFRKDWRMSAVTDPFREDKEAAEEVQKQQMEAAQQQQAEGVSEQLAAILPELQQKIIGEVGVQLKPVLEQAAQLDAQQQKQIETHEEIMGKLIQVLTQAGIIPPHPNPTQAPA